MAKRTLVRNADLFRQKTKAPFNQGGLMKKLEIKPSGTKLHLIFSERGEILKVTEESSLLLEPTDITVKVKTLQAALELIDENEWTVKQAHFMNQLFDFYRTASYLAMDAESQKEHSA
jgi:hypothetical protein